MTWVDAVCGAVLLSGLGALAWIDARTFRLPDMLTIPLILLGLLQAWLRTGSVLDAAIGAAVGYLAFVAIEKAYRALRARDGLGRGDAKLLAVGGAWCGWMPVPMIVMLASGWALAGLLLVPALKAAREGKAEVPFGPFLSLGIAAVWIWQVAAGGR